MTFNKNTFLFSFVAIIILVIFAAGLLLLQSTQQKSEQKEIPEPIVEEEIPQPQEEEVDISSSTLFGTSNWQTYHNEEFGFEVKYPGDVFAVVPIEGNFVGYGESTNQGSKLIFANRKGSLGKEECSYGETDRAWICRAELEDGIVFVVLPGRLADFQVQYTDFDAYREEVIGGRKGFYWGIDFEFTHRREHYYIALREEKTLYIQIFATGTYQDEIARYTYSPSEKMVDQILSTFRFIQEELGEVNIGKKLISLEGFIDFEELEGGCWYILVDREREDGDAEQIELIGIDEDTLQQYQGKVGMVKGEFRSDLASVCQIGQIFQVEEVILTDHPLNFQ